MLDEQGATDLLKPKPRSAAASLPLCNYSAPGGLQIENKWNRGEMIYYPQVEMTQAEYARIHADYKGTRVVGNSHRVRTAMQRHTLVSVFLTDAKTHTPLGPQEPAPRELREPRIPTPRAVPAPDPQAEQFSAMREILKAGVQVVAAPQLFPTPPDVAARMVELADLPVCNQSLRILEPSAGTGRLIDAAFTHAGQIVAVEKNYSLAERLRTSYATVNVQCEDFLECNGNLGKFDRVLMNPPFENGSDIKHIQHAITFLKPGGRLVAICANGPRQTAILQPLATEWEELPERTFAGTGVRTVLFDGGSGGRGNCMKSSMSKRVALYARVSTSNGQQDPEMQLRELREYAKHRELIIVGEYIDRMTGSTDSRPAINRLMADACQRRFDAVLVWKLDRFGRSLRHLVNAIAELEALGVAFISFRDNLDLTTPSGRLMFQIIGAMAEFERALIQERVRAGLRNAKAKGKTLGRPRAVVNIEEISALREQGLSWAQITHQTGTSKGTAQRVVAALRSKEELLATYA
jgi:DNA invertase Pin-like site-specific DNA recombinase/protein-L-isoaspartate O-methyltransferase